MYLDRLDGRIDVEFFDRTAGAMREEQARVLREIESHQTADQTYIEEGIKLLDLARRAHGLFESQPPCEKRKMLDFVLSNCTWKEGTLTAEYRQPFGLIADAGQLAARTGPDAGVIPVENENWLRGQDSNPRAHNAITNPPSPLEDRINGVLSNMPEFQKAFSWKPGQQTPPLRLEARWDGARAGVPRCVVSI